MPSAVMHFYSGQPMHFYSGVDTRAWKWRRQIESGAVSTIQDIAVAENVSDRFVGRMIRLAYLAPCVMDALVIARRPPAIALNDLVTVAELPWDGQMERVFE
jgi:hypothetical protein